MSNSQCHLEMIEGRDENAKMLLLDKKTQNECIYQYIDADI